MRIPFLTAMTLCVLLAGPAFGACRGQVETAPLGAAYPAYSTAAVEETATLRIAATCDWRLVLVVARPGTPRLGDMLDFDVTGPDGDSLVMAEGEERTGGLPGSGDAHALRLTLRLGPDQTPAPGSYGETLPLRLFDVASGALLDEKPLPLRVLVPQHLELSLAGADIATSLAFPERPVLYKLIDFGEFEQGEQRAINVLVRGNVRHSLVFRSANGGVMRHTQTGAGTTVPYSLRFDGTPLTLTGETRSETFRATGIGGTAREMQVTIGDISRSRAGTYSDTIEIVVEPHL